MSNGMTLSKSPMMTPCKVCGSNAYFTPYGVALFEDEIVIEGAVSCTACYHTYRIELGMNTGAKKEGEPKKMEDTLVDSWHEYEAELGSE